MEPKSKILVLSHCLLNKGTRWWQNGKPVERNIGLAAEIVKFAIKHNIGVFQMPCPEFTFCGNPRPSRTKDEYEMLPGFREYCNNLAGIVAEQLRTLISMGKRPRFQILAIVGVKRSPSCAVNNVIRVVNGERRLVNERGFFMDALERRILKDGLNVPFLEFDFDSPHEVIADLGKILRFSEKVSNFSIQKCGFDIQKASG
jgi:predicted secreted protein